MTAERLKELLRLTYEQVANALDADINGDESIIKEVFEETRDDDELQVVLDALIVIRDGLLARAKEMS